MGQGLLIQLNDGLRPLEVTANIRAPSFCRSVGFSTGGETITVNEYVGNSQFLIIPRNVVQTAQVSGQGLVWRVCNHIFAHDGNQITYRTWASNLGGNQNFHAIWDSTIWQILPVGVGSYGLNIANSTDFTTISDASRVGCCVFAGRVHIDGEWRLPDVDHMDRSTMICFANWSASGITLTYDGDKVFCHTEGGSNAAIDVNIAVFAVAPILAPSGSAGLAIWNRSNQLTFSTYRRPFLWDGFKLALKNDWQGIGDRMVSLGRYGVVARNGGHHLYGFQMLNGQARLGPGHRWDHDSKDFDEWMSGEIPCIQNII